MGERSKGRWSPRLTAAVFGGASAIALLACCEAQAQTTASGTFQGIGKGMGSGESPFSEVDGVSANGLVVVGRANFGAGQDAFRWTASGGLQDLGALPGVSGINLGDAHAVNADGTVVVGSGSASDGSEEAFRWTAASGMVGIGYLGGPSKNSTANAVSADGSIVVGRSTDTASHDEAFRWTAAGGMVGLGFLGGGGANPSSVANGVSADGSVIVGSSSDAANHGEPFRYTTSGGMVGLGFIGGGGSNPSGNAFGVSADGGVVVGQSTDAANRTQAFRWSAASGIVGLGFIAGGGAAPESFANAVSSDGSVVVGESTNATGQHEAFRWTQSSGIKSLFGLFTAAGVNLAGFTTLINATGVSADGQIIVGYGTDASGQEQGWIGRYVEAATSPSTPTSPVTPTTPIAGVTSLGSVMASVQQLNDARLRVLTQQNGVVAQGLSPMDVAGEGSRIGVFASGDDFSAGVAARFALGDRWVLSAAAIDATNARYDSSNWGSGELREAVTLGASLRALTRPTTVRWFAEAGGWIAPDAEFTFGRAYANGSGVAVGVSKPGGDLSYAYGRIGGVWRVTAADRLTGLIEGGRERIGVDRYDEHLSAANPFEAHYGASDESLTVGKFGLAYTHDVGRWSLSASVLGAHAFDYSNNLSVTVTGIGLLTPIKPGSVDWAEYQAELAYRFTPRLQLGVFLAGVGGDDRYIAVNTRAGVAARLSF